MRLLFLASLLGGLLVAAYAMLRGVERHGGAPAGGHIGAAPEPSAIVGLPMGAAFAAVFGATGYLLDRSTALGPVAQVLVAAAVGAAGAMGALALVAAWAVPSARAEAIDTRYVLMGQVARVTSAIRAGAEGAIAFELDGTRHAVRARGTDDSSLDEGSEVVIERVEADVAYVEAWARVEERL